MEEINTLNNIIEEENEQITTLTGEVVEETVEASEIIYEPALEKLQTNTTLAPFETLPQTGETMINIVNDIRDNLITSNRTLKIISISLGIAVAIISLLLINAVVTNQRLKSIETTLKNAEIQSKGIYKTTENLEFIIEFEEEIAYKNNLIKDAFAQEENTYYDGDLSINARVINKLTNSEHPVAFAVEKENETTYVLTGNSESEKIIPGRYQLQVEFEKDGIKETKTQDFTWGVLVINTNKSVYEPGDTANFAFAVLDEGGNMICDAYLELTITDPTGSTTTLTSQGGEIFVNPECKSKNLVVRSDYEAEYKVEEIGTYKIYLKAITSKGEHFINDSFKVMENVTFDIERITSTRIYPVNVYPVILKVTPDEDFSGNITEKVPEEFEIFDLNDELFGPFTNYNSSNYQNPTITANKILGFKELQWEVNWEKDKTYYLGYTYDSPDKNPEFYLLGPAQVIDKNNDILFTEMRKWQLAIDDVNNTFRVKEYYLSTGDFTTASYNLTLDDTLAANYFMLIRGSKTGDGSSNADNDYARVSAIPGGLGELADSGSADTITITRFVADVTWEGVVTVVECLTECEASGFRLLDIVETSVTASATSGTDTSGTAWTDINDVVLFGGFHGGGAEFDSAAGATDGNAVQTRLYPTSTNTINWERNSSTSLLAMTMTTFVVEWGSEWTVQRVNVSGNPNGNGCNAVGEYNSTGSISSVTRDDTWVWGTGNSNGFGIGDSVSGTIITLGDGVAQNTTETSVAFCGEYNHTKDLDIYAMTHADLAVDYRFKVDGDGATEDLAIVIDTATAGQRFSWITNGTNGSGTAHPRDRFWSRYTANGEVTLSHGFTGQNYPAWIMGVDFNAVTETTAATPTLHDVPFDNEEMYDTTPDFEFTSSDPDGTDDIIYQIQWDDNTAFSSPTTKTSDTDTGFINTVDGGDISPFTEGERIRFTVQSGDALSNSAANTAYYWKVKAKKNYGGGNYGSWAPTQSLRVNTSLKIDQWLQTTDEQFATGTLAGTATDSPNDRVKVASSGTGAEQIIFVTSGTSWAVPTDWNDTANTIHVIGGGGGGGQTLSSDGGGGGGGGAYSRVIDLDLTPDTSVTISIGSGGGTETAGGDTYFNGGSCGTASACAKGGAGGNNATEGSGGAAGSGVGDVKYSGGTGGNGGTGSGGGGGGSGAGPNGNGEIGGDAPDGTGQGGGGGGGAGGTSSTAGANGSGTSGGDGGNGPDGTGGGAGGPANTNGTAGTAGTGGGGGAGGDNNDGAVGAMHNTWVQTSDSADAGPGGGGGGPGDHGVGANGAVYGGAGSGASDNDTAGSGANGIIVVQYFPLVGSSSGTVMSPAIDFDWVSYMSTWKEFDWSETETNGTVDVSLYYNNTGDCDTIIPNAALSGNESGFSSGPINITGLSTVTYNRICLEATLTNGSGTPYLEDWYIDWGFDVSGVVYLADKATTATTGNGGQCNGSTANLTIRMDGSGPITTSCSGTDATFTFSGVQAQTGDTLTLYSTDGTDKSNRVYVSDGGANTLQDLYKDATAVADLQDGTLNILDMLDYDNDQNSTDMLFDADDASPDIITWESGTQLYVPNGYTFAPNGNTNGHDIEIDGMWNAASAETINVDGSFVLDTGGTLNPSTSTLTFDATSGTEGLSTDGTGNLYNLVIDDGGGGSLVVEVEDPLVVSNDLTITDGSLDVKTENNQISVGRNWTNNDIFLENSGTVILSDGLNATLDTGCTDADTCTSQNFYNLTIDKGLGGDVVTLSPNDLRVTNTLTITSGELVQGAQDIRAEGSTALQLYDHGRLTNFSTGNLTLGGDVVNDFGAITLNANGASCGDTNSITIASTDTSQRSWSGNGAFRLVDVSVSYQTGSAVINTASSTNGGNMGANWYFVGCDLFLFSGINIEGLDIS